MAGEKVIRQHFVPQTYLKRFGIEVNGSSRVRAVPTNDLKTEKIFESSTANICLKKNLYTLPGNTPEETMLLEKFYAENYESKYSQVYDLLINSEKMTLTPAERELIISTVVTMLYRTTKWINQHNEFLCRVLERAYSLANEVGKDYILFDSQKISIAGKTLKQLQDEGTVEHRPIQVMIQLRVALSLLNNRLKHDAIQVGKLADGEELITSDNPVLYYQEGNPRPKPFDSRNILELPIDSKHVLMLMPFAEDEDEKLHISRVTYPAQISKTQKITSNHNQYLNAEQFIIGSNNALTDFVQIKETVEAPLTQEEIAKIGSLEDIMRIMNDKGIK